MRNSIRTDAEKRDEENRLYALNVMQREERKAGAGLLTLAALDSHFEDFPARIALQSANGYCRELVAERREGK